MLGARERISLLRDHLRRVEADVDPDSLGAHLSLGPAQVQRAVRAAQTAAMLDGGRVTAADLHGGIRAQNAAGLERLARRIEPEVGWDGPGPGTRRTARAARSSPPGRVTATRSSWTGGCARAAGAGAG